MSEKEYKKAVKYQISLFDKLLDKYEDMDFTEITGRMGGDVVTFRVYKNGMITER